MAAKKNLKSILERNIKAIRLRPSIGQGTATTTVRVRNGVTCDIEDGDWKLVADEGVGDGGAGLGPDPGVFGRAALGTCLAMGYMIWSSYMEVPIESVEVVVEADYDARGMFAIDGSISPGWSGVRYTVHIASPADEHKVRELVDFADRHSPLLTDFREPIPITRELRIAQSVED
jgi:uncharacterized OsmC-like protein